MTGKITREPRPLSAFHYKPGRPGETAYCGDCRAQKPMAKNSGRCADCAAVVQEIDAARVMPDPPFRGSTHHYSTEHIYNSYRLGEDYQRNNRELAEGERRLGWFILPPFQRPEVWTEAQRVRFIESIWLELPIGAYCYNRPQSFNHATDTWLIDGQQRISTILAYVAGEFAAFGYRFTELAEIERRAFGLKSFPAIEVCEEDPVVLEDIYNRLAYGGTAHEAQPIRVALPGGAEIEVTAAQIHPGLGCDLGDEDCTCTQHGGRRTPDCLWAFLKKEA